MGIITDKDGRSGNSYGNFLELVEIKVEGKNVNPEEYFAAGDDWLEKVSVKVRNTSDKPISRIMIIFFMPEAKLKGGFATSWLEYSAVNKNTGKLSTRTDILRH